MSIPCIASPSKSPSCSVALERCGGLYKGGCPPGRQTCQNCNSADDQVGGLLSLAASLIILLERLSGLAMFVLGFFLLVQWILLGQPIPLETNTSAIVNNSDHVAHTIAGLKTLQQWYNSETGKWGGWWTSANQMTMLADFAYIYPEYRPTAQVVFKNTFMRAPNHQVAQLKINKPNRVDTFTYPDIPDSLGPPVPPLKKALSINGTVSLLNGGGDWLNWFYDDEGWWALGWLKVYDITNNTTYLNTAIDIFDDMVKGTNATCGGIWWNKAHEANVAISNELFLALAAQLANRAESNADKARYLDWAVKQWRWFLNSGLINADNNINDGLDLKTCKNNNGIVWSYNQGVILGGLVELNKAQPDNSLIVTAQNIANAAIKKLSDENGILHDVCEPHCGNDGPQFKGILMRGLQALQQADPQPQIAKFIEDNANSIWNNARGPGDKLDLVWSGPYEAATASTQSSALDALVAAVALGSASTT